MSATRYTVRIDGLSAQEAADALAGALREVAHGVARFGGPMRLTFAVGPSDAPLVATAILASDEERPGPDYVLERLAEALESRAIEHQENEVIADAAERLLESLGEYVRQSMHANREWSDGVRAIDAALFARKKRLHDAEKNRREAAGEEDDRS